jgi:beta-glucanase (GH16 family)
LSRMRPRARAVLACAATAGLLAGCGSSPSTPDLLSTLPSPAATVPPVPPPPPPSSAAPTTAAPSGNRSVRVSSGGGSATLGAGTRFRPVGGDEFNSGSLDVKKWGTYDSIGGFGNGLRRPSAITQSGGNLVITASGKTSGGMADNVGQLYGRWEFRARTDDGRGFGSAILLWPDSEKLSDGEIDIAEVPFEKRDQAHMILHSGPDADPLDGSHVVGDFSQWHTFAVDWLPDHITWYVDGRARFTVTNKAHIPNTPMHLAIQLDQGPVNDWLPAPDATTPAQVHLQVDWVRKYALGTAPAAAAHAAAPAAGPAAAPATTQAAKPSPTKKPSDHDD